VDNKKRDKNENLKKFSSTNQPPKNGRPKKFINRVSEETGYKKSQITDCMLQFLKLPLDRLKQISGDTSQTPSLETLIARAIYGDCKRNEMKNLSQIMDRSFGKPTEFIESKAEIKSTQTILILPEKEIIDYSE
jgi:hypothetical protein